MTAQDVFLNMVDIFSKILPSRDGRTSAVPLKFVTAFIFSLCGDSRTRSLEGLRREMMGYLMVSLSSSSFWERLSRKRLLVFLRQILAEVMIQVTVSVQGSDILKLLKVTAILIVDSTSIELPEWAAKFFPGTGSAAAVKWHTCLDVMRGNLRWNRITPGRLHDRNCFPDMADLIGRLVIFDLGYWDYSLLQAIDQVGGFYLSRLTVHDKIFRLLSTSYRRIGILFSLLKQG